MIHLRKTTLPSAGPILAPVDQDGVDALRKMKDDQIVRVDVKRSRSWQQHKKFFARNKVAFDNQVTDFATPEALRKALFIKAGYYELLPMLGGGVTPVAESMAFDSMSQDRFNEVYNTVGDLICEYVMPGTTREELEQETPSPQGAEPSSGAAALPEREQPSPPGDGSNLLGAG